MRVRISPSARERASQVQHLAKLSSWYERAVDVRPTLTRCIGALALAAAVAACGERVATTPPATLPAATIAVPTPGDLAAFAAAACVDAYERCVEGVLTMAGAAPGSLVAICDYQDGTGDVVVVDTSAEAESECSDGGLIAGSRVIRVVQLP